MMKHIAIPQVLLNEKALLDTVNTEGMTEEQLAAHQKKVADISSELSKFGDIEMTAEEEAAFLADQAASQAAQEVSDLQAAAQQALKDAREAALDFFMAGQPFPSDWQDHVVELKAIIDTGVGAVPDQPLTVESVMLKTGGT